MASLNKLFNKDGTGQSQRSPLLLDPGYIPIDERSIGDWISFARSCAKELVFFDADNKPAGTWEGFLGDGPGADNHAFIADIIRYIDNPGKFADDPEKMRKLSRPHLVLFITFLQLLVHIKDQLNGFTKKHLDFYYFDILGLDKKKPLPDMVNMMIELAEDVNDLLLEKGTAFIAGKDTLSKDLIYQTTKDTIVSRAEIQNIKTLFADKKVTGIKEARENSRYDADKGLLKMMQLALGHPDPGDPLPDDVTDINRMQPDYTAGKLFLSDSDFQFLKRLNSTEAVKIEEWHKAYDILENAYKEKIKQSRQEALKKIRENSKENGFADMLRFALGDPDPGNELPVYKNAGVHNHDTVKVLKQVYEHLIGNDAENRTAALDYIRNELLLKESELKNIIEAFISNPGTDWSLVYKALEAAQRMKRNVLLQAPFKKEWLNIYAVDDAKASAFTIDNRPDNSSLRFNTFGKSHTSKELTAAKPANVGFAVSSPQLLLTEGKRKITLAIYFQDDGDNKMNNVKKWLSTFSGEDPFLIYITNDNKTWIKIKPANTEYGFGRQTDGPTASGPENIYANAMRFQLNLDESDTADASKVPVEFMNISSAYPLLVMVLNQVRADTGYVNAYQQFKDFRIEKLEVTVQVENIKALALQNDNSVLNYKKPFEPFGYLPEAGSSLYFAHPEICGKQLDILSLNFEWMNPPADFNKHYKEYWIIDSYTEDVSDNAGAEAKPKTLTGNAAFSADLKYMHGRMEVVSKRIKLFNSVDAGSLHTETIGLGIPVKELPAMNEEVLHWSRYFSMELCSPDFQHHKYTGLLNKQALFYPVEISSGKYVAHPLRKLFLKPPYTPKLKSLTAGYTASFEMNMTKGIAGKEDRIFHITPFGNHEIYVNGNIGSTYFLPEFGNEGELYIGLALLRPPQSLSLLFQMAEGSADPDLESVPIRWSYLSNNIWKELTGTNLVSDTTNGLLNTGIIEFNIPEDATNNNTLIHEGLHWLRAGICSNADAIPDTIAVFANGIHAVFADHENANDHLLNLLPPQSIKETVNKIPEVKKISQPFTSFKGKPAETDPLFYRRVSERLRHKNRAVTTWDYERLVLEQFPEIYKVKCMPGGVAGKVDPGAIVMIVIPDIKGKLPFDPFQPKAPQDTLHAIQQYIGQRMPAWASVKVKNPDYVQVRTRFAVKFREGYNESFYKKKLEEDLKRFLSPWAYEEGADITINGKIYPNVIVNFVAERLYTAYVAGMKIFCSNDTGGFEEVIGPGNEENAAEAANPAVVFVSAQEHIIDLIREQGYIEEDFTGINYMKIEVDFKIA